MFGIACSNTNNQPTIKFSKDSASIIINNIEDANILQVKKLYQAHPDSVNFMSVFIFRTERDSLQHEEKVKGTYAFKDNEVIFKPNKPFDIGKSYLVESYINVEFASVKKMFNNAIKSNLEPQQQILTR